jgi:hypothetical protein
VEPAGVVRGWNWGELISVVSYYQFGFKKKKQPIISYDDLSRTMIALDLFDQSHSAFQNDQ